MTEIVPSKPGTGIGYIGDNDREHGTVQVTIPGVDSVWEDYNHRIFEVKEVNLKDRTGIQIRGRIAIPADKDDHPFGTTLQDWARTFRDKTPPSKIDQ
jgi:hypothetical protein